MSKYLNLSLLIVILFELTSCSSSKYIFDSESKTRQDELQEIRSKTYAKKIGLGLFSAAISIVFNIDPGFYISGKQYRKIRIENPTSDTLYINMLTNSYFDEKTFCDFRDIRIPPNEKFRILTPLNADYNLYYSPTIENNDDKLLEFNTSIKRKITLIPDNQ